LKERNLEETTESVRNYFVNKNKERDQIFDQFKNTEIKQIQEQNDSNSKKIEELFSKAQDLKSEVENIGALDLHEMLNVATLGFPGSPKRKLDKDQSPFDKKFEKAVHKNVKRHKSPSKKMKG